MKGYIVARLGRQLLNRAHVCHLVGELVAFGRVEIRFEPPPPHSSFEGLAGWLWTMSDDPMAELAAVGFVRGVAESPEGWMMGVEFGTDEARLPPPVRSRGPSEVSTEVWATCPTRLLSDSPGGVQLMGRSGDVVGYVTEAKDSTQLPVGRAMVTPDARLDALSPSGGVYDRAADWSVMAERLAGGRWLVTRMEKGYTLTFKTWFWMHQIVVGVFDPDVTVGEVLEAYRAQGPSDVSG